MQGGEDISGHIIYPTPNLSSKRWDENVSTVREGGIVTNTDVPPHDMDGPTRNKFQIRNKGRWSGIQESII